MNGGIRIPDMEINIYNLKVMHMSGTSSLVIGRATYDEVSSESKTINGVGNAYGDGSCINMSPYKSTINDSDGIDKISGDNDKTFIQKYPNQTEPINQTPTIYTHPYTWSHQRKLLHLT